ncbi:putative secreted protein [Tunisvirus fontaine2]|uniref:Putative secreted protein n=1 Tax=Tunisvirus fontaine2 TaxID=1421067 RepID=V9SEU9_9VIRU|nr:putative secreted protein [Tunisvirus fontaine2]AHC54836.1 putative secreted protein [Tunisvirus fontaine2]
MGIPTGVILAFIWWIWRSLPTCVTRNIAKMFDKKTTAKVCRKKIKVPLWISGQKYNVLVKRPRKNFIMFSSILCDGRDKTLRMIKYLGPDNDFFGSKISPRDLGYREVEFQVVIPFEKSLFFSDDQQIIL